MDFNESIKNLKLLYENSDDVYKKFILKFLNNDIPKKIENLKNNLKQQNELIKLSDEYINDFLINSKNRYFYIQKSNTFISYDNKNFNIENETNIVHFILTQISKNKSIKPWKYKIKNTIIKKIKATDLFKIIPESLTIQNIINFFMEKLFVSKEFSKYFLTIIGDIILRKEPVQTYLVNETGKKIVNSINDGVQQYLKNKNSINNAFKYCNNSESYNNCRIIYFDNALDNRDLWLNFIKKNIINIIIVAVYYSNRYESAEHYINSPISPITKNNVLKIKNESEDKIFKKFILYTLNDDSSGNSISLKEMKYIWSLFLNENKLPNLISLNNLSQKLQKNGLIFTNNKFINIRSPYLKNINIINNFWDSNVVYDINDEIEVSEFCDIYNKSNSVINNNSLFIDETIFKIYLEAFHNIQVVNKYIYSYKYRNWDKIKETNNIFDKLKLMYKNSSDTFEKGIDMIYIDYCQIAKTHQDIRIVGKKWFDKYIIQIIPEKYIIKKRILNKFWEL